MEEGRSLLPQSQCSKISLAFGVPLESDSACLWGFILSGAGRFPWLGSITGLKMGSSEARIMPASQGR